MSASLAATNTAATATIRFTGDLDLTAMTALWRQTLAAARAARGRRLILDLTAVTLCDTAGATLLSSAERTHGTQADLQGATADTTALFTRVRAAAAIPPIPTPETHANPITTTIEHIADAIAFLGETVLATLTIPARRRMLPIRDLLALTDSAGVRAIPLVLLLGFLMGLILAFQSSIPLKRFGADIFVVNLVAISLTRELGPLLASVILAGRTGSAFAAELGTMVVNDEVAAIRTMGIDPVTMLVLPRLIAAALVMPGLALLLELAGFAGMTLVMRLLGYPPIAVLHQTILAVHIRDLVGGLVKATVFGAAVAAIGCRTGLAAGLGPRAVGQAATAAVVGGIVATILIDGLFTVLFYRLGL